MSETIAGSEIRVELPRSGIGADLRDALAGRGLLAELVDEGETCELHVRYADEEQARLLADVTHAIEGWLGEQTMPLVVQHGDGRCVVRPPGD